MSGEKSRQATGPESAASKRYNRVSDRLGRYFWIGAITGILLFGGLGGWAASANLAGAVIASGTIVVDSNVKKIQHPTGGVVGEIRVRNGDRVKAGDLLLRLDDTIARANHQIIQAQLDELTVRKIRLSAERDGADVLTIPPGLILHAAQNPTLRDMLHAEKALFTSRQAARDGQKRQLRERIAQLRDEIEGLEAQQQAKSTEIDLIADELVGLTVLKEKDLTTTNRLLALEREAARLKGERAHLMAGTAQARGRIAETELQILQIDQDLKSEAMKELREIQGKIAELKERRVAAEDQLRRVEIRSPDNGFVHQLAVHSVGAVILQSEPALIIVPDDDALVIEARIDPEDIDQVTVGQRASIKMLAFNQRTTPAIEGLVNFVSADLMADQKTGGVFFVARIALPEHEQQKLGKLTLKSGMPAEVQIQTSGRTPLAYLIKPLRDQFGRAFREQ